MSNSPKGLPQPNLFPDFESTRRPTFTRRENPPTTHGCIRTDVAGWDTGERPAEKILRHGPNTMSDAEILSLLLNQGGIVDGELFTTVDVARSLLSQHGSLFRLSRRMALETTSAPGIGRQTAARIAATFEVARRIESQRNAEPRVEVSQPKDVAAVYGPLMRDLRTEEFRVVYLSAANTIIGDKVCSRGGLTCTVVEPRAVFAEALLIGAAAVVALHNHPSSNPEPSREDVRITRQLAECGKVLSVPLHDHIILYSGGQGYTSLAERGVL